LAFCGESNPIFASWVTFWIKVGDSCPNGTSIPNKGMALCTMSFIYEYFSWPWDRGTLRVKVDTKKIVNPIITFLFSIESTSDIKYKNFLSVTSYNNNSFHHTNATIGPLSPP
jgi:hypothetical protein